MSDNRLQIRGTVPVRVVSGGGGGACIELVASTGIIDRYGEVIEPRGWRLENYRKNPVFLNSHRYGDVTATLGRALVTEVRQEEGRDVLFQRVEFAVEVSPQARVAYGLYRGGFLHAVSVGFIPLKWEDGDGREHTSGRTLSPGELSEDRANSLSTLNPQLSTPPRRRYLEQELVEVSAVAVPANSEALVLGVRSGAVAREDVMELLEVDGWPKKQDDLVRALWSAMGGGRC
jgi:phage head maturation protease